MYHASYRYRRATPVERFKMNVRYWLRMHLSDLLGFICEMIAGFARIISMFFIIIAFAMCSP